MSKAILHRPARNLPPPVPTDDVVVVPPPPQPGGLGFAWWPQLLFPLVTSLGSAYFVVYNPNPTYIAISLTMALASVALSAAMIAQQLSSARRRAAQDRDRYIDYLRRVAQQALKTARLQHQSAQFLHPAARELWAIACNGVRVWERRRHHPDFATVRIGSGRVPLVTPLRLDVGGDPMSQRDPELLAVAEHVIGAHRHVDEQPLAVDLREQPVVSLVGNPAGTRAIARSLVTELATLCAPDDLLLAICHPPGGEMAWDFARWLPHLVAEDGRPRMGDGYQVLSGLSGEIGGRRERRRRRSGSGADRLGEDLPDTHLVLVVDGFSAASPLARQHVVGQLTEQARDLGASLIFLVEAQRDEPAAVHVRVMVGPEGSLIVDDMHGSSVSGHADQVPPLLSEAISRRLAPLQLAEKEGGSALAETCQLMELLGVRSAAELDPRAQWRSRQPQDALRIPIGVGTDGSVEILDLKEAAQGGYGPHGLVVGATGSGKSELLRTLVTALAATHAPDQVSFVLVDFKGGAAFAGLSGLPHVAGMITNLADDLTMVDRMHAALFGEMQRRQNLLRRAGNLDTVREYQAQRVAGALPGSEPVPYLIIFVDEFGELLASRPDFIELFVAIGRVGRSLGMHLLLASQRLEEGRLRGLESHLSYRICLRTFSAAESQAVIGSGDAFRLPAVPGSAFLKVHSEIFDRFKAALVSAPDRPADESVSAPVTSPVFAWGLTTWGEPESLAYRPAAGGGASQMQVVVDRVRATGAVSVHQVWLPQLPAKLPLRSLLPSLALDPKRGLQAIGAEGIGGVRVPIGVLDLPLEQTQRPFILDFAGWAGHVALVGAPQTGKSTFLRTLLLSLIATHTPDEARIYAIDYGGGSLFSLMGAPHVGGVTGRLEPEKVRRTVNEIWSLVDERDARLREHGVDSPEALRRRRPEGGLPPDLASDVFLVVDGWGALREEFEDLEASLRDIATRGLRVAVHLVLTANRWYDIRPNLRDSISGRLELRLNDAAESEINRRAALNLPAGVPGRVLAPDGCQVQIATPELGGRVEEIVATVAAGWDGAVAPRVRMLPPRVIAADLPALTDDGGAAVQIGVDELELAPVVLDLSGPDAHFLVFGDSESGKTTFLRSWMSALQERKGADQAMLLVIDYRRTLLAATRPEQLWAYCGAAPQAVAAVRELATGIVDRLPSATLSPEAIASRSWWTGPDFYVIVDDYDLVSSSAGSPLVPLVDLLAQGRDLGLHLVLARRVGGMVRAGMDPIVNRLRELHAPGLILSGDPAEGPILGMHRAAPQPPGRGLLVRRKQRPLLVQTVDRTAS